MSRINFNDIFKGPVSLPSEAIFRTISNNRIDNAKTLADLRKIAKEFCDECKRHQIKLDDVLYELEDKNIHLKNKIGAKNARRSDRSFKKQS